MGLEVVAAEGLGRLRDPRAVKPLVACLVADNAALRRAGAEALGNLGLPNFNKIFAGNAEDWRRLGACGDPRGIVWLVEALAKNAHDLAVIAESLGKSGDPRAVRPLVGCLDSWDEGTRKAAADGLQGIGAAHGPQLLVEALPDASAKERSALVDILLRLRDARAVLPVIQVAGHASAEVRQDAAYALNRMGDIRACETLIKLLDDQAGGVRANAAEGLGRLRDRRATGPLIKALGDEDGNVRQIAAEALNGIGEPKWRAMITGNHEDCLRLGASSDPRAFEPLSKALGSRSMRGCAAEALGKLGDARAVGPLIAAMGDKDHQFRETVTEALAQFRDRRRGRNLDRGAAGRILRSPPGCLYGARQAGRRPRGATACPRVGRRLPGTSSLRRRGASGIARSASGEPVGRGAGDWDPKNRKTVAGLLHRRGEPQWTGMIDGQPDDFVRLGACRRRPRHSDADQVSESPAKGPASIGGSRSDLAQRDQASLVESALAASRAIGKGASFRLALRS